MWGGGQPRLFVLTEALDGYLGWHRPTLTTNTLIFSKKEVSKVLPLPPATSSYLRRHKGENSISHRGSHHCSTGSSISINTVHCSTAALSPDPRSLIRKHELHRVPGALCRCWYTIQPLLVINNCSAAVLHAPPRLQLGAEIIRKTHWSHCEDIFCWLALEVRGGSGCWAALTGQERR